MRLARQLTLALVVCSVAVLFPYKGAEASVPIHVHQFNMDGLDNPDTSPDEAKFIMLSEIAAGRRAAGISLNEICLDQYIEIKNALFTHGYANGMFFFKTSSQPDCVGSNDFGLALMLAGDQSVNYYAANWYVAQQPGKEPRAYICSRRLNYTLNIGMCGTHLAVESAHTTQGKALHDNQLNWSLAGAPRVGLGDFNAHPTVWWDIYYPDYYEADPLPKACTIDSPPPACYADYLFSHKNYMAPGSAYSLIEVSSDHDYYIGHFLL